MKKLLLIATMALSASLSGCFLLDSPKVMCSIHDLAGACVEASIQHVAQTHKK